MTQPQTDPASDVGAALARLAEQTIGLQRQATRLEQLIRESEVHTRQLTDERFVTHRSLIDSQTEKVTLALDAAKEAIAKAETATEKRFDSVNEFRQTLTDQAREFMPKSEAVTLSTQATERIRELTERITTLAGRDEVRVMNDRNSERIAELTERVNRIEAHGQGAKDNRTGIYAALAVATTLIVAMIAILNFVTK